MRKIENEIVTKSIETVYEACDGKRFKNEADCKAWEDSYRCTITKCFQQIPQIRISGSRTYLDYANEDDEVVALVPRNLEDIKVINAYAKETTCDEINITHESIGRVIILNFGYDHDWCGWYDMDKHFEQIKNDYENYKSQLGDLLVKKENNK